MKPILIIEYCPKCNWMLRAAWLAQELLSTFETIVNMVALKPSETNGKFCISIEEIIIYDRKTYGGFPEPKVFKQIVRDAIAPEMKLGHSE